VGEGLRKETLDETADLMERLPWEDEEEFIFQALFE